MPSDPKHDDGVLSLRDFDVYEMRRLLSVQVDLIQQVARSMENILDAQNRFADRLDKIESSTWQRFCERCHSLLLHLSTPESITAFSGLVGKLTLLVIPLVVIIAIALGVNISGYGIGPAVTGVTP